MKKLIILVLILSLCLVGCGQVSESTLNEILEKDPSFEKVLSAKKCVNAKVSSLRDNFNKEKDIIMQKTHLLKKDLQTKKNNLDVQISTVKQELKPQIDTLKERLEKKYSEYKLKNRSLKDSLSKLKNIRKLLEKKSDLSLSSDEVSVWNKKISDLEKEIDSLRKELDSLRAQNRLLETKIKVLKQ